MTLTGKSIPGSGAWEWLSGIDLSALLEPESGWRKRLTGRETYEGIMAIEAASAVSQPLPRVQA
jgi:hypothetical protein